MNADQYLKELSQKEADKLLTDEDREFCRQLAERLVQNPPKPKRNRRKLAAWIGSTAAAAAVVLGIVLPITLSGNPPAEDAFFDEYIVSEHAEMDQLQQDCNVFLISELNDSGIILLYKDIISNKKLYYELSWLDIISVNLVIVINEKYQYSFDFNTEPIMEELNDYTVIYTTEYFETDIDGIYGAKYHGYIKVETETVYFDYTQAIAAGDEAFFADIQQIVQLK